MPQSLPPIMENHRTRRRMSPPPPQHDVKSCAIHLQGTPKWLHMESYPRLRTMDPAPPGRIKESVQCSLTHLDELGGLSPCLDVVLRLIGAHCRHADGSLSACEKRLIRLLHVPSQALDRSRRSEGEPRQYAPPGHATTHPGLTCCQVSVILAMLCAASPAQGLSRKISAPHGMLGISC